MTEEERETGKVSAKVYKIYLLAMGSVLAIALLFSYYLIEVCAKVAADYSLSFWSQASDSNDKLAFYAAIYASLEKTII